MGLPFSRDTTYAVLSQVKSADLNNLQDWVIKLFAEGRLHRVQRNWGNQAEGVGFVDTGTGAAAAFSASDSALMQGFHLRLRTLAAADTARGSGGALIAPPQLANYAQALEWDVDATNLAGAGPVDADLYMGIMDLLALDAIHGIIAFKKTDASANWFVVHCEGDPTAATTVDTGVAVSAAAMQRMRILWAGSDFTDGPYAKFYIDDVLVHTAVANLPNDNADVLYPVFDLRQGGATAAVAYISPYTWLQARNLADGNALLR